MRTEHGEEAVRPTSADNNDETVTVDTRLAEPVTKRKPWVRPGLIEHTAQTEGGSINGASDVSVFQS